MIYEALLAPQERPPTLGEVKRALLTFDKVLIVSPDDRDLFPSNAWLMAMGLPPFMGYPVGPIRPLGKLPNYDNVFRRFEEELKGPIEQGLVKVISTYELKATQQMTIGGVPTGEYPIHPNPLLRLYRTAARSQNHLQVVLDEEILTYLGSSASLADMFQKGQADVGINDDPALPMLNNELPLEDLREPLTVVARSRIATVIKTMGYCEAKSLIPLMTAPGYTRFTSDLIRNTKSLLTAFALEQPDPYWMHINRVFDAIYRELIDSTALDALTLEDVLKLRTTAWGKQAKAREDFFASIQRMGDETAGAEDKQKSIDALILDYKIKADDVERERTSIKYKAFFDFVPPAISALSTGALAQMGSPLGAALTLVAGLVWANQKLPNYGPELMKWREKQKEFRKSTGYALTNFTNAVNTGMK